VAVPDFLVIGAPKAGTTALHAALSEHPGLYMSAIKEPKQRGGQPGPGLTAATLTGPLERFLQRHSRERRPFSAIHIEIIANTRRPAGSDRKTPP